MAKKSAINRNENVKRLVKKFEAKREALKAVANDESLSLEERFEARLQLRLHGAQLRQQQLGALLTARLHAWEWSG